MVLIDLVGLSTDGFDYIMIFGFFFLKSQASLNMFFVVSLLTLVCRSDYPSESLDENYIFFERRSLYLFFCWISRFTFFSMLPMKLQEFLIFQRAYVDAREEVSMDVCVKMCWINGGRLISGQLMLTSVLMRGYIRLTSSMSVKAVVLSKSWS